LQNVLFLSISELGAGLFPSSAMQIAKGKKSQSEHDFTRNLVRECLMFESGEFR
jgi:hypothetical protein